MASIISSGPKCVRPRVGSKTEVRAASLEVRRRARTTGSSHSFQGISVRAFIVST